MLALRPDTFERMVLEERVRGIALSSPPGASRSDSDREPSEELR